MYLFPNNPQNHNPPLLSFPQSASPALAQAGSSFPTFSCSFPWAGGQMDTSQETTPTLGPESPKILGPQHTSPIAQNPANSPCSQFTHRWCWRPGSCCQMQLCPGTSGPLDMVSRWEEGVALITGNSPCPGGHSPHPWLPIFLITLDSQLHYHRLLSWSSTRRCTPILFLDHSYS